MSLSEEVGPPASERPLRRLWFMMRQSALRGPRSFGAPGQAGARPSVAWAVRRTRRSLRHRIFVARTLVFAF